MKKTVVLLLIIIMLASCFGAVADEWKPTNAVQIICTTSAGGGSDNQGRVLIPYLQDYFGQTFTVVNKPGANTELGTMEVMESTPDGYTIGVTGGSNISTVIANEDNEITYDGMQYLAYFGQTPFAYVTKPDSPFKTITDVITYAKDHPGALTIAVSGASHKLLCYDFCAQAGVELTQVDFSSGGDSLTAVLGGHVDLASLSPAYFDRLKEAGCNLLAVCGDIRQPKYPDVETFIENGLTCEMVSGIVLFAPKDLPEEIIDAYTAAFNSIGSNPAVEQAYIEGGLYSSYLFRTGDELKTWLKNNSDRIATLTALYMK